jgi:hypothetical protein
VAPAIKSAPYDLGHFGDLPPSIRGSMGVSTIALPRLEARKTKLAGIQQSQRLLKPIMRSIPAIC